jgi:hypothetical protein
MKKTLVRMVLATVALLALSTTALPDGGGMPPWCPPGAVCK